jgi:hypothetical protein
MDIFCISPEVSVSWPTNRQHRAVLGTYLVLETLNSAATSAKTRTTPRKRFGRPKIARRLPGLDLRSAEGKRYSIIYAEVAAEFGAEKRSISRLREVAGLRCALEQIQTEVVRGSPKARDDMVRVSNLLMRREKELQDRIVATALSKPSVQTRLSERTSKKVEANPIDEVDPLDMGEADVA